MNLALQRASPPNWWMQMMDVRPEHGGQIGVELERGIFDPDTGATLAIAHWILPRLSAEDHSPEPSACQVESKTRPMANIASVMKDLRRVVDDADAVARTIGCELRGVPTLPDDFSRVVYPSEAYRAVADMLTRRGILDAAMQVMSVQINIGCSSWEELQDRYTRLVRSIDELLVLGDLSEGKRQRLYRKAVPNPTPVVWSTPQELYEVALSERTDANPAKLHKHVVIKPGGIIEVRCFDSTSDMRQIEHYLRQVARIAGLK